MFAVYVIFRRMGVLLVKMSLVFFLLVLLDFQSYKVSCLPAAEYDCNITPYCSANKLKPFLGDIEPSRGLATALRARSYNKEIILFVTSEQKLVYALHAIKSLKAFSIEHFLLISFQTSCEFIAKKIPSAGCAWSSYKFPQEMNLEHVALLWMTRYRTLARAVRLGYNVLSSDTDVIFFHNPYTFFKNPPFSSIQWLSQPEVIYDEAEYPTNFAPNGGFLYVQNASSSGPASWLIQEAIDRLLRWMDDGWKYASSIGIMPTCNYMDQDTLTDSLPSVFVGRPMFSRTFWYCRDNAARNLPFAWFQVGLEYNKLYHQAVKAVPMRNISTPPAWRNTVHSPFLTYKSGAMRMPCFSNNWPSNLGVRMYPPTRGPLSNAWLATLAADCPSCPSPPNVEDPAQEAKCKAVPNENFSFLPPWFTVGFWPRGRKGWWYRHWNGDDVPQVIGHLHFIAGAGNGMSKFYVMMALREWDWDLARVANEQKRFQAQNGNYEVDQPLKVLALHPSIKFTANTTAREYWTIVQGLGQVARLLNRVAVWPDVPCSLKWALHSAAPTLPLPSSSEFLAYGPSLSDLSCMWWGLSWEGCMHHGRGMAMLEFEHFMELGRLNGEVVDPTLSNTILGLHPSESQLRAQASKNPGSTIVSVPSHQVLAAITNSTLSRAFLYLGHPVQLVWPNEGSQGKTEWETMKADCNAFTVRGARRLTRSSPMTGILPGLLVEGKIKLENGNKSSSIPA